MRMPVCEKNKEENSTAAWRHMWPFELFFPFHVCWLDLLCEVKNTLMMPSVPSQPVAMDNILGILSNRRVPRPKCSGYPDLVGFPWHSSTRPVSTTWAAMWPMFSFSKPQCTFTRALQHTQGLWLSHAVTRPFCPTSCQDAESERNPTNSYWWETAAALLWRQGLPQVHYNPRRGNVSNHSTCTSACLLGVHTQVGVSSIPLEMLLYYLLANFASGPLGNQNMLSNRPPLNSGPVIMNLDNYPRIYIIQMTIWPQQLPLTGHNWCWHPLLPHQTAELISVY